MYPSCLRHTHIPGTSRLFLDYLYNFDRVERFFPGDPFDKQSFRDASAQIQFPAERRSAIVSALREQNPSSTQLSLLAEEGTVAVVTGQQVGLFSGPAYTVYKAVTAIRLARELTESGLKAVPVFWLATEDHDLAEVDHAWSFTHSGEPVKFRSELAPAGGPVGNVRLEDDVTEQLARSLRDFPFGDEVVKKLRQSYRPGATLGQAFRELLGDLLEGTGIVFLDPLHPSIREIAAPFLAAVVKRVPNLVRELRDRNQQLEAEGYHTQVHIEPQSSLLFLMKNGQRLPLLFNDGQFIQKKDHYSPDQLEAQGPSLSPNALLRPVMQDYLLPTVSYVGGPAEIAYMAQAQVLYRELLGRMPVIFPRNGFTLIDNRSLKLMARYQLQMPDLLDHKQHVQAKIAAQLVPAEIKDTFAHTSAMFEGELARIKHDLLRFDPTLSAAVEKSTAKMSYQLKKLAGKVERETLRRDEQATRAAEYLANTIYPHQHLQERFYSIMPFLAQHGLNLVWRLLDASRLDCPDHMVRTVSEMSTLVYSN